VRSQHIMALTTTAYRYIQLDGQGTPILEGTSMQGGGISDIELFVGDVNSIKPRICRRGRPLCLPSAILLLRSRSVNRLRLSLSSLYGADT
jgi:hypothetical protein